MDSNQTLPNLSAREQVIAALELISNPVVLSKAQELCPTVDLIELIAKLWFNQIYPAGDSYLECLRGDRSPVSVEAYRGLFDEFEWQSLERFHHFFELRIKMLPAQNLKKLGKSQFWPQIAKDAAYALETFNNISESRSRLNAFLGFMLSYCDPHPSPKSTVEIVS